MNLNNLADQVFWQIDNPSPGSDTIRIAGWAFRGCSPDKPIMLMHHANGICGACWAEVAQAFASEFSIYAIDARGHGDSQRLRVPDDYDWSYFVSDLSGVARSILQTSNQNRIAVGVGSSFGGIVTAAAAAQDPGLFQRVFMFDPPVHSTPDVLERLGVDVDLPNTDDRAGLVARTLRRRAVWDSRDAARAGWREKPLFAPWQDAAFDLYLQHGMGDLEDGTVRLKCDPTVEAHIFETTGSLHVMDYAEQVQVPVHLVHAEHGFFSGVFFRALSECFPQGEFGQLPGGHMLPLEVPDLVVDFMRVRLDRR